MLRALIAGLVCLVTSCGARTALDSQDPPGPMDAGRPDAFDAFVSLCTPERVVTVDLEVNRPSVGFMLDRSNSMGERLGDSMVTRTGAMRAALVDVLPMIETRADIGAVLFPGPGRPPRLPRCDLPTRAVAPIQPNGAGAIISALDAHPVNGGTPIADSLPVAYDALRGREFSALVLITDGGPNCHPDAPDGVGGGTIAECIELGFEPEHCLDSERTLAAIATGLDEEVPTYIVAVDVDEDPALQTLLERMAIAGGRPRDGDPGYYEVSQPDELIAAFETIAGEVVFCRFGVPSDPEGGTVRIDGESTEAWRVAGARIELTGDACVQARAGAVVTFEADCDE